MGYNRAIDSPPRYQFEPSSGTTYRSQIYNCGPASISKIAQYYTDKFVGIESNRWIIAGTGPYNVNGRITYGAPAGTATTAWQQAEMLRRRGVACAVYGIGTTGQLADLVRGGRRPVLLGLNFARVSDYVAGHTFNGWHAIAVLDITAMGFIVNDPNFSTYRPDRTNGKRLYTWNVMQHALADSAINWAVVPLNPKPAPYVPPPPAPKITEAQEMAFAENIKSAAGREFRCKSGVTLRKGPGDQYPYHYKTKQTEYFWLHGFYPNHWVLASRDKDSTGFFWVPPNH